MTVPANIVVVDDQSLYREGLVELIGKWEEFSVVGEAADGVSAVKLCGNLRPQLVLMDIKMPGMDGLEACKEIRSRYPEVSVIILSLYCDSNRVLSAVANGANGYLLKNIHASELRKKLLSVLGGDAVLSDEAARICLEALRTPERSSFEADKMSSLVSTLTDHEVKLLKLIAKGYSNKDIAESLYVGESTVKKQVSLMLTKLNLSNRVKAAVFALRSGLAD